MPRRYKNEGARRLDRAMKDLGKERRGRRLSYAQASQLVYDRSGTRIARGDLHRYQANTKHATKPGFANRKALSIALGIPLEAWDWKPGGRSDR